MRAELIAIGTELLLGYVVNRDAAFLGRTLAELGIDCTHHVTVGDNRQRLREAIRTALSRADAAITCGGLGPTVDDITLETIAEAAGRRLILNRKLLAEIKRRFKRLKIRMPKSNIRQAMAPEGAIVLPNRIGTAPGLLLKIGASSRKRGSIPAFAGMTQTKLLIALPGPPAELIPMVRKHLVPRLRRYTGETVILSRTLKLTGLTESEADAKVRDLLALKGRLTVGIYARPGQVELRITAKVPTRTAAAQAILPVERAIRRRLKHFLYGADEETLEQVVGKLLRTKRQTLAVAESCTGGLVQHRITEAPGSSDYFRGGVVVYADDLKENFLGVPAPLLRKHGAVSEQTARAMAEGIRKTASATLGLAVTGIAGPSGGTKRKPVGRVVIALSAPRGSRVVRHQFSGDRSVVKFKASQAALDMVRLHVIARPPAFLRKQGGGRGNLAFKRSSR